MAKTPKKSANDASSRDRIIHAAKVQFARTGFDGASTRQIAEVAKVAQSLLLYHFETKEDLWKAVMDRMFERTSRLRAVVDGMEGASAAEKLKENISVFVDLCREDPDLHRLMTLEGRASSPRLEWLIDKHVKNLYDGTIALVEQGQRDGSIRQCDPRLVYYSIIAIAGTIYSLEPEMRLLSSDKSRPARDVVLDYMTTLIFV